MPRPSNKTTTAFACFVIFTFQIMIIGNRAYSQSVTIVMTLKEYAAATICSEVTHT